MFLLKENPLGTSFDPSGYQLGNQGGFNFIIANEKIDENESNIHHAIFLISPTTHLFPLASQLRSRGVSSMITFEIKIWIMKSVIKVYNPT